jgi:hypothetical protein
MLFEAEPQAMASLRSLVLSSAFVPVCPALQIWRFSLAQWEHLRTWCRELYAQFDEQMHQWASGELKAAVSVEARAAHLARWRRREECRLLQVDVALSPLGEVRLLQVRAYPRGAAWAEQVARASEIGQRKIKLFYPLKAELDSVDQLLRNRKLPHTVAFVEDAAATRSTDDEARIAWYAARQLKVLRVEPRDLHFDGQRLRAGDWKIGVVYRAEGASSAEWENVRAEGGSLHIGNATSALTHQAFLEALPLAQASGWSDERAELSFVSNSGQIEIGLAPVRHSLLLSGRELKAAFFSSEISGRQIVGCSALAR